MTEWQPEILTKILFSEDKNFEIIKKTVYDSLNGTGLIVETNTENCTTSTSSDSTSKGFNIAHTLGFTTSSRNLLDSKKN